VALVLYKSGLIPTASGPAFVQEKTVRNPQRKLQLLSKDGVTICQRDLLLRFTSSPRCRLLDAKIQPWLQQLSQFRCHDCAGAVGFRSRRRTFSERYILPLFYLQPVRCAECFRRDYRLMSVQVRERLAEVGPKPAISATGRSPTHDRHVA
jgi:hypothetical protein